MEDNLEELLLKISEFLANDQVTREQFNNRLSAIREAVREAGKCAEWDKTEGRPSSLPASGGNADTVGGMPLGSLFNFRFAGEDIEIPNQTDLQQYFLYGSKRQIGGPYRVVMGNYVTNSFDDSSSDWKWFYYLGYIIIGIDVNGNIYFNTIINDRFSQWVKIGHIPSSLPANGGNADTAQKLKTPRSIALSGGATGTATNFDGSANITIPVTALDMGKASAGILPASRGGTGSSSLQATRNAMGLGNTTGALPLANGGTGAASAAAARTNLGAAAAVHTHTKAQISDFPASLPANGGNADTVGGLSANNFKGHPSYNYQGINGGDANDYTNECHQFVFNMANIPLGDSWGFLDVSHFNGAGFTPSDTGVTLQRYVSYHLNFFAYRLKNKSGWSEWISYKINGNADTTDGLHLAVSAAEPTTVPNNQLSFVYE